MVLGFGRSFPQRIYATTDIWDAAHRGFPIHRAGQDVGRPHVEHVLTGTGGVGLPRISFSSQRGINHHVKSGQFYGACV